VGRDRHAWGTAGLAVIIFLSLVESWDTVDMVCAGMFTNNTGSAVITDDVNLRLKAVMRTMTEAEKPNKLMRKDLSATEMNCRGTHGGGHPCSATIADGDDRDGLQA
jgi:urea-proton symporter